MKVSNGYPLPFYYPIEMLAMIDMESKLEMREGLPESSDKLLDFNIHFHFFFNSVS
jgi:hypothetical protein